MAALSVNINKFALIRNARGANIPNIINISEKCLQYGADGITVHPRPDERHAKFSDLAPLQKLVSNYKDKEFNIEGYPSKNFIDKVISAKPHQVTLVPDPPEALTSSFGWNCDINKSFLTDVVKEFQNNKIRVSLFVNPSKHTLENLGIIATDRVELYTYEYAHNYSRNKSEAIKSYVEVSQFIQSEFPKIEFNAGHDLSLENLEYFLRSITNIKEVSIGHALICDTFEFGLEKTIKKYLEISSKL